MAKRIKVQTVPTYTFEDTSDENIQRVVDSDGNWTHYFLVKEKKYVKAITHVLDLGYSKGPRFKAYLLSITKDEQQKVLTEAGDRGSRSHRAIQDLIMGTKVSMTTKYPSEVTGRQEVLSVREWKNLMAFVAWCEIYKPRVIAHEQVIATGDFAGTFDALVVITVPSGDKTFPKGVWGKDVLLLPDWKTSAGIWDEYKAQTAAYLYGIIASSKYDKFLEAYSSRIFTGVVRLGTKHANGGYEFKVWDESTTKNRHYRKLFMGALAIANEIEPDFKPEIKHLPTEILIKLPKAKVANAPTAKKATKKK